MGKRGTSDFESIKNNSPRVEKPKIESGVQQDMNRQIMICSVGKTIKKKKF